MPGMPLVRNQTSTPSRSGACPLGGPADLRVFGLEAAPTTYAVLSAAPVWALAPKGTVNLLNIAGDERPGLVNFSVCEPGVELCRITVSSSVTVRAESIDHFMEEHKIGGRKTGGIQPRSRTRRRSPYRYCLPTRC
jgi:hypothetical protein